jgi:NAD-dependent SIR2 family protein deacetylase
MRLNPTAIETEDAHGVFLVSGAGVSAESGLGTFRDKGGTGV